jgi:hypothetical protein
MSACRVNYVRRMKNCEFVIDEQREESKAAFGRTGWETVVFQLMDEEEVVGAPRD